MPALRIGAGDRFGMLLVLESLGVIDGHGRSLCVCDCGERKEVVNSKLKNGVAVSCGCYKRSKSRTHGRAGSKVYTAWRHMIDRCSQPKHRQYPDYGGRGIFVCERWRKFENFLSDVGERPEGTSIDRINNDRGYEPGNCRWATSTQQNRNSRHTKLTAEDVNEIRGRYEHGERGPSIAARFGIVPRYVVDIVNRKTWRDVQ